MLKAHPLGKRMPADSVGKHTRGKQRPAQADSVLAKMGCCTVQKGLTFSLRSYSGLP